MPDFHHAFPNRFRVRPAILWGQTPRHKAGAGDAFASVLLLGLQHHWPLEVTLRRAHDFASAVVTQKGATLQDIGFYLPFISQWQL